MPCYYPLEGYRARRLNESGKRSITFDRDAGYSDMPIKVPCGQCIGCRLERSRQWAIRCVHEAQQYNDNCFITLTYDDDHVPRDGSLKKKIFRILSSVFVSPLNLVKSVFFIVVSMARPLLVLTIMLVFLIMIFLSLTVRVILTRSFTHAKTK